MCFLIYANILIIQITIFLSSIYKSINLSSSVIFVLIYDVESISCKLIVPRSKLSSK